MIERTELANVFLSDPRRLKGHVIITPARHVEAPWELTAGETAEIYRLISHYQKLICQTVGVGCDLRQHYRPHFKADNYYKVDHVHYHLLPRVAGDAMETEVLPHERRIMIDLPDDERENILQLLK